MEDYNKQNMEEQEQGVDIRALVALCIDRWYWFILSLIVVMGLSFLYVHRSVPTYHRSATILIKDERKGASISAESELANLGLTQGRSNTYNEIASLSSPYLMDEVVRRLALNESYTVEGHFYDKLLYGSSCPVKVVFDEISANGVTKVKLTFPKDGTVSISDFYRAAGGEEYEYEDVAPVVAHLMDTVQTPVGRLVVTPTLYYDYEKISGKVINVSKVPVQAASGGFSAALKVELTDKLSSVLSLSITDINTKRAEDILSTVIDVYNERWVQDKNLVAVSTSDFIEERIKVLERDLGEVEKDIASYKSSNLIPSVDVAAKTYWEQSTRNDKAIDDLNNHLAMAKYMRDYIGRQSGANVLIPANSGMESAAIERQIATYNEILLNRNNAVQESSVTNPVVQDMDRSLVAMREAIILSIDNYIVTLDSQIQTLSKSDRKNTSRLADSPSQAKYLLSVERQQKVKETLYLYLLQKREENELSKAFTAYNTRVITPPRGSNVPVSPKAKMIYLLAFVLGLAIPFGITYILETINTKVVGRKDIEGCKVPFIGEVPEWSAGRKINWLPIKEKNRENVILVKKDCRDIINEAFRVLRTNLEFVCKSDNSKVVLITSFNPGAGKSFLIMNIAASLAVKGKKVLVIDADLRHASCSTYVGSPHRGLSDYLGKRIGDIHSVVVSHPDYPGLDVLPVGTIPPNPTELLEEARLAEVFAKYREEYDYVLVDCPPVEMVADTQIISALVDRSLFVVRAGVLERSMIGYLDKIYDSKRLPNLGIVLNGTQSSSPHYYRGLSGNYGSYAYGNRSYYVDEQK